MSRLSVCGLAGRRDGFVARRFWSRRRFWSDRCDGFVESHARVRRRWRIEIVVDLRDLLGVCSLLFIGGVFAFDFVGDGARNRRCEVDVCGDIVETGAQGSFRFGDVDLDGLRHLHFECVELFIELRIFVHVCDAFGDFFDFFFSGLSGGASDDFGTAVDDGFESRREF